MLPGIGEVLAEEAEVFLDALEVAPEPLQCVEDFLGLLFDFEAAQAEEDGLEVGVETVRGYRYDALLDGVAEELVVFAGVFFDDGFVVNILGGDVHEGEIVGAFVGENVFSGDGVHVLFDVAEELFAGGGPVGVGFGVDDAPEVFVGEFGVHGDEFFADLENGVHGVAVVEAVLEPVVFGGEDLGEEVAKEEFAHAAAEFGGAHDGDEFGGGLANFVDLADFFAEVADDAGGGVEPGVHGGGGLLEVFGDGLAEGVEALGEGVELLLEHQRGLVRLRWFVAFALDEDEQGGHRDKREQAEDDGQGFHAPKLTSPPARGNALRAFLKVKPSMPLVATEAHE